MKNHKLYYLSIEFILFVFNLPILKAVLKLPYSIAVLVVIKKLTDDCSKVWIRNSYYLDNFVVGLSDLDFTIGFKGSPSKADVVKKHNEYLHLKRFLPFLGEVNVISFEDMEYIKDCFNPLEAKRDPVLSDYFKSKSPSSFEKVVFLVRMFESDAENFFKWKKLRLKKWRSHLNSSALRNVNDIKNELVSQINLSSDIPYDELADFLESYLLKGINYNHRLALILFPHRWAVWANVNGGINELLTQANLSSKNYQILIMGLRWELMGLYTQYRILEKDKNITFYTKLLHDLITFCLEKSVANDTVSIDCANKLHEMVSVN